MTAAMTSNRICTVVWSVLVVTTAVLPLAAQQQPLGQPGTAFTLRVARVIQNGAPITLEMRGIAAGGVARLDVTGGTDAASFPAGSYLLISDTTGAARLVDSLHKSVRSIGAGARLGGLVELHTPPGVVSDVTVAIDTLGAGEMIDGRATRRYRLTTRFSLTMTLGTGETGTAQSNSVTELWQAVGAERIPNPFVGLGGGETPDDFLAPLNRVLVETARRIPGVTLRSETQASLSARGIAFTGQQVSTRLSDLRPAVVDPASLQIPSGFTRQTRRVPPPTSLLLAAARLVEFRWEVAGEPKSSRFMDPQRGVPVALSDSVVLDMSGIDSAWVTPVPRDSMGRRDVVVRLSRRGAARFGATTATHVGRRLAVIVDGRITDLPIIESAIGEIVQLASDVAGPVADSLAARVNAMVVELRPFLPVSLH